MQTTIELEVGDTVKIIGGDAWASPDREGVVIGFRQVLNAKRQLKPKEAQVRFAVKTKNKAGEDIELTYEPFIAATASNLVRLEAASKEEVA